MLKYDYQQPDLFEPSWGVRPELEGVRDQLNDLIPGSGRCEKPMSANRALEKFRVAQNLAYDLFNNGLMNSRRHFSKFYGFSPFTGNRHYSLDRNGWSRLEYLVENQLTPIMLRAAQEQGIKAPYPNLPWSTDGEKE